MQKAACGRTLSIAQIIRKDPTNGREWLPQQPERQNSGCKLFDIYGWVSLFCLAMWYVDERFDPAKIEALPVKGFTVRSTAGVVRVEKYGCGAEFRKAPDGKFQLTHLPAIMANGQFTRLWDAGYQKFLLTDDGRKLPALASQLTSLRRFNEELRAALGVPTYYNEAIGSTCHISAYDRVLGRPGDRPEESVGARTRQEH
jgi:hypothetical protein